MEEALLGQKQIRHYFKQFSEQQWNRLSKATMMLGIQSLMFENKKELFWDFSQLSLDQIEDIVVDNEIKLIQRQREMRAQSKEKKQNFISMEKAPLNVIKDEPQLNPIQKSLTEQEKKIKKVTVISPESQSNIEDDQSSVVPQLSNSFKKRTQKALSPQQSQQIQKSPVVNQNQQNQIENQQIQVNRRHQKEFQKHKSSEAMSLLLKTDEALNKRQNRMVSGIKNSRQQPSQKEKSRTNIYKAVQSGDQIVNNLPQVQRKEESVPKEGSRDPSFGRPSSRWRQGVSNKDNLSKLDEEYINFEMQNKNKGMIYPTWWQTQDDSQKQRRNSVDQLDISRSDSIHGINVKHGEDSLDLRIRKARENVYQKNNYQDQPRRVDARTKQVIGQLSPNARVQCIQENPYLINQHHQADLQNDISENYPSFDKQNIIAQQSKTSLPSPHSSSNLNNNIFASSSTKMLNLMESGNPANNHGVIQQLSRTNGSQGSFAYTNDKGVPKYSPVRARNPGNANIPMSYSGPPTQNEMNRDALRHMSGNRNFSQTISGQESHRNSKAVIVANKLVQNSNRIKNNTVRQQNARDNKQRQTHFQQNDRSNIDNQQLYLEQQREAERNRLNVQRIIQQNQRDEYLTSNQEQEVYNDHNSQAVLLHQKQMQIDKQNNGNAPSHNLYNIEDLGMQKYAKGGFAMTISASMEQEERSRSGSKPKFPFMDQQPFRGNDVPLRKKNDQITKGGTKLNKSQKNNYSQNGNNQQVQNQRKIPKELNNIESTIKSKIEYDRRVYQERQRQNQMKDFQSKNYEGDINQNTDNHIQKMEDNSQFQENNENSSSVQPQIFYKRNDRTLIYEQGVDDSYRGDYQSSYDKNLQYQQENQQQYQNDQSRRQIIDSSVQQSSQYHDSASSQSYPRTNNINHNYPKNIYYDDYPQGQNGYQNNVIQESVAGVALRKRTISPSTQKAIQSDQYEINNASGARLIMNGQLSEMQTIQSHNQIEIHAQQRSSFAGVEDQHNETGFTQKLYNQQKNNPSISYTQLDPSNPSSSAPNARKISDQAKKYYKREKDQAYQSSYANNNLKGSERNILNQVPPPNQFNNGYYDQNGDFHYQRDNINYDRNQIQEGNRGGKIQKWQQQIREGNENEIREEESSYTEGGGEGGEAIQSESENRNNTSRFALGSGDEQNNNYSLKYQKQGYLQRNPNYGRFHRPQVQQQYQDENGYYPLKRGDVDQNNSSIVLQQHRGDNLSAEQNSSFINPNISISQAGELPGGEQGLLKNQLEQMLMMKSGEFSAGRGPINEVLLSSVGTASLGNDRTNSSGIASAPRPEASAYHQYGFVKYQPQLPDSKYLPRNEIQDNYGNSYSYKKTQHYQDENKNQMYNQYSEQNKDVQRNIRNQNEQNIYQEQALHYTQENQKQKINIEENRSQIYQAKEQINSIPYQNYKIPPYQQSYNKHREYQADEVRLASKIEVPFIGQSAADIAKAQQSNQTGQRSQTNFHTSKFAQQQNDRAYQLNKNDHSYQKIDIQNPNRIHTEQYVRSSLNNSHNQSQASAGYKRASGQTENNEFRNSKLQQHSLQKENPSMSQQNNSQNHGQINSQGNNFTLQRPSAEENLNQIRTNSYQNNYYLDNSRASIPSNRGPSRSPPKQNQIQIRNPQLDHRISSGKRDPRGDKIKQRENDCQNAVNNGGVVGQTHPNSNYYQTFNQNKIQKQQYQEQLKSNQEINYQDFQNNNRENEKVDTEEYCEGEGEGEGEEDEDEGEGEGEDYDNMGAGEDMEGTSQMSSDQPSNGKMTKSQIQNGDDSMAYDMADNETKTENLRNFMEQAQPGNVLINSQGLSQQDTTPNKQMDQRKLSIPPSYPSNYNQLSKPGSQSQNDHPSIRTEDKEGGSIDEIIENQNLIKNKYNLDQHHMDQEIQQINSRHSNKNQYVGLVSVSDRQGAFISSGNSKDDYRMYKRDISEESSPEISQTEQTSQIVTTNKKKIDEFTNDNDDISSSFQETPAEGEITNSLSNTNTGPQNSKQKDKNMYQGNYVIMNNNDQIQNNMQKVKKLTEKLAKMGGSSQNKKRPVEYSQESSQSQMQNYQKINGKRVNTQSVSISDNNNQRQGGQISADSDESLSPLRDSEL